MKKNVVRIIGSRLLILCAGFMILNTAMVPLLYAARPGILSVRKQGSATQPVFYVSSRYPGTVEAEFHLTKAVNVISEPQLPARFVIPPGQEVKAFALRAAQPGTSLSYDYSYSYVPGDPRAQHRPPRPYRPPFESGKRFRIGNGFNPGSDPFNAYSVSLLMPEGTPVCAGRDGILTEIAEQLFRRQTVQGLMEKRATLIRIQHDDGTMAVYGHLQSGSTSFAPGSRIREGQVLGLLGSLADNTGLLFIVQKNEGFRLVSIPFQFGTNGGQGVTPTAGMVLSVGK